MSIQTIWTPWIPAAITPVIIALYVLIKKKKFFTKLKTIIPYLVLLLISSGLGSFLSIAYGNSRWFQSKTPSLILGLVSLLFILIIVIKTISFFVFDFILGQLQHIGYSRIIKIKDVLVIILYITGFSIIGKYYLKADLTVVAASSAILTVVAGFALQDILGDFFSGIALNLEESLNIGDWIRTGTIEGKIEQFRWRSIKIRTTDNTLVVIPNRIASKQEVQRFGHVTEPFAVRLRVGISYDNSPDVVITTLRHVTLSIPSILKSPEPVIMLNEFSDFAITYEIKFWILDYSLRDPIKSELRRLTWYAFKRENIKIPVPIRDVYVKSEGKGVTGEKENAISGEMIDIVKVNEVLNTLNNDQLNKLLKDVEIKHYGKGETLIGEGEVGQYFFHILEGEAEVLKDNKVLARLKPGDYMGEISLFTGEKTVAEVRVAQESKILRISSERFRETVQINEPMARKLSEVIASRRAEIMEFTKKEEHLKLTALKQESENIFLRIKKYFSI
ncbi:MAG: cyclic nucleotide-binding domain-containing protein [Candidatus Omnitrophota bacterium]